MKKKTTEEYLHEINSKGIIYLPLEPYSGSKTNILHSCPNGHTWYGMPSRILLGHGCNKCAKNTYKTTKEYDRELFYNEIDALPIEEYRGALIPILHRCFNGHEWKIAPTNLLKNKRGCPSCAAYGFNPNISAILYCISFKNNTDTFYKIGITNRTVEDRFSDEDWVKLNLRIEWTITYTHGTKARDIEKQLLHQYKDYKVNTGILKSGNTETLKIKIPITIVENL